MKTISAKDEVYVTHPCTLVTKQDELDGWFSIAKYDPEVYRFYGGTSEFIAPTLPDYPTWGGFQVRHLNALSLCSIDRARRTSSFNLFTCGNYPDLSLSVMCKTFELMRDFDVTRVETLVHITNTKSYELNKRLFGEPWGVKPRALWDRSQREWVGAYCFSQLLNSVKL